MTGKSAGGYRGKGLLARAVTGAGERSWRAAEFVLVAAALLPLLALLWKAAGSSGDLWLHLVRNVLPASAAETALLLTGTGILVFLFGVTTAWLVSQYRFPGREILEWALILPLSIPTYIAAYAYVEFLDFTGPVQTILRSAGGYASARDYWFPDIRSTGGAIFLMGSVLYPYVYLSARVSFRMQSGSMLEVARVLGAGTVRLFWKVGLPAARPAIAIGITLALMETLNDIGAVEHLGVRTLTFSVYDTWLMRSNLAGAAQLSLSLLLLVALLMHFERRMRGRQSYSEGRMKLQPFEGQALNGWKAWGAALTCFLPVLCGFGIPAGQLVAFTVARPAQMIDPLLLQAAFNSLAVAIMTALLCVAAGFLLIHGARRSQGSWRPGMIRLAGSGYAVPGTILAIGVLTVLAGIDNAVSRASEEWLGFRTGLLLSGTMFIIVYACTVRFLAVAMGNIEAGYSRISPNLHAAARTLGRSELKTVFEIELPLLRRALGIAGLFVLVETMKELSATLMLRPFNFNTLATHVYERASRALFEESAFAALLIVLIGIVPVYWLTRVFNSEQGEKKGGPRKVRHSSIKGT